MKVYKTNKLFYGKWLYKIETKTPGASLIKHWGFERVRSACEHGGNKFSGRTFTDAEKKHLSEYLKSIEPYFNRELKTRVEHNTLNFFINDYQLYKDLSKVLEKWVVSLTEPVNETEARSLQEKSSTVLCNHLPHNKYQYRVYIKSMMPNHQRQQFKEWLSNYRDKIHYSKSTEEWLNGKTYYSQSPFLYIEEQGLLLMIRLYLGSWVKKTHEFVLRNT